jgi:hypothetical protein
MNEKIEFIAVVKEVRGPSIGGFDHCFWTSKRNRPSSNSPIHEYFASEEGESCAGAGANLSGANLHHKDHTPLLHSELGME